MANLLLLEVGCPPGSVALGAGVYWRTGSGNSPPLVGNYVATTLQTDGSSGDTTTGDTATGTQYIKILHVGSISTLNSWSQTINYNGVGSSAFEAWNGTIWTVLADTNVALWPTNVGASSQTRVATFAAEAIPNVGGLYYLLATFAAGSVSPQSTDSRPSA